MMNLADDLMTGIKEISQFTGESERRLYHLAETGQLALFKMGRLWCGRKSTLLDQIAKLEREAELERDAKLEREAAAA